MMFSSGSMMAAARIGLDASASNGVLATFMPEPKPPLDTPMIRTATTATSQKPLSWPSKVKSNTGTKSFQSFGSIDIAQHKRIVDLNDVTAVLLDQRPAAFVAIQITKQRHQRGRKQHRVPPFAFKTQASDGRQGLLHELLEI